MDGKRTSVYLTPDLAARVKLSGRPLAALIAAGLDHPPVTAERVRKAHEEIRELTAEVGRIRAGRDPAPDAFAGATDEIENKPQIPRQPVTGRKMTRGAVASPRRRCTHPGTRVIGGWCPQCQVTVLSGGYLP